MENSRPVKELELYIIRHGQSMGNAGYPDGAVLTETEKHDPVLTEKGIFQAQKAGEYLSDIEFDALFSSAMLRAVQTATEIIGFQKTTKKLLILPLICEMMISPEYNGASLQDIRKINPDAVLAPDIDEDSPMIYHNASDDEKGTFERAEKALAYLRSHFSSGEKIAVVSHGAFITYLVFSLMGFKDKTPVFDLDFNNTGITKVTLYKEGTNRYGDIIFEFINDTAHLKDNGKL